MGHGVSIGEYSPRKLREIQGPEWLGLAGRLYVRSALLTGKTIDERTLVGMCRMLLGRFAPYRIMDTIRNLAGLVHLLSYCSITKGVHPRKLLAANPLIVTDREQPLVAVPLSSSSFIGPPLRTKHVYANLLV